MEVTIDAGGRIVVPKSLRDALGLAPGTTVDVSAYGRGLMVVAGGRSAVLIESEGVMVATSKTAFDDEVVFSLVDASRR